MQVKADTAGNEEVFSRRENPFDQERTAMQRMFNERPLHAGSEANFRLAERDSKD